MKNSELEKEIKKVNARIDMLMSEMEKQNEVKCAAVENYPRRDDLIFKTYDILRRMKYDSDIKNYEDRILEIDDQIKGLEKEKQCWIAEKQDAETRYFREI